MAELSVSRLSVVAGGAQVVSHISLQLSRGEFVVLLGPNGAGKSMTLRAMLGLVPSTGSVTLDGASVPDMAPSERARHIAYLPQSTALAWPARTRDVVSLGRFSHGAAVGRLGRDDAHAVDMALSECALEAFSDRRVDSLSGGEMARVHCARAFAARTTFLLADEPVAALDPAQAFRIMDLLQKKARRGLGVLVVLHDIALAARYADRMILMKAGELVADGPTESVLTGESVSALYGVTAHVAGRQVALNGLPD
ncbi:ABC transporter ATP-binding protein [Algimonas porphyrae]|uniref:ABC transporter n=1 Tax=Algimonas porphyrae TaxID=1128113 RepID=A0ABQ5V3M0_9PROT|nr:ABC transporter ATP-binding protein [Algimonas porphyrae]GLQ21642.1 ABC transporter [Algimonas porphyrae]